MCVVVSSAGNGGESASRGGGAKGECESALELCVLSSAFFFWGGGGPVSLRAVKGE